VLGSSIGPVVLITFGVLLASRGTGLSTSANPLGDLAEPLPTWFLVPYLLVAAGGLVAGALLDIYSSGLNLLTLGLRRPRYQSVAIDLLVLGVPLAAWAASSWWTWPRCAATATTSARCTGGSSGGARGTPSGWPDGSDHRRGAGGQSRGGGGLAGRGGRGPRADHLDDQGLHLARLVAKGPFAGSSLGLLVAFVVAGLLYGLWAIPTARRTQARPALARS